MELLERPYLFSSPEAKGREVSKRRVVVTGLGAVTPLGTGVERSWQALCAGQSGIGRITRFDARGFSTQIAGEVRDFCAEDFMAKKLVHRTSRFQHFALAASQMALEDAHLEITPESSHRIGVGLGTTVGGIDSLLTAQEQLSKGEQGKISPFFIPAFMLSMAAGQVSILLGLRGPSFASTTACAAGTHAIGDAFRLIQRGEADAMLAGGAETGILPLMVCGLGMIRALSSRNQEPERASRPFDRDRDGFVVGEGGAVLVLEELDHALDRGARVYAEIIGYGANSDAYHITAPSPGGEGAARCMALALRDAGISPSEVDYINAHGTSTRLNDTLETVAIKKVFGEHARTVMVSSNKSMIGHLWGAAGAVEAVFTVLALYQGMIPPTINYENPDPECDLDYVPHRARKARVRVALSNSFGFGGTNGVLVLKAFSPDPHG